jgi:ABC-type glycerol-3-phosphate transport system substrate-binding protein
MSKSTLSRRTFLRSAVIAAAGLTAACAPSGAPAAPAAATEGPGAVAGGVKEKITLSMWTHDNLYVQFFTARANEWKEKYPQYDFTFDFQQIPEVFTKMLSSLSANEPVPDLFGLEQGWFGPFMKDDIIDQKFVDLTNFILPEKDKFVENNWSKFTSNGKVFGVDSSLCACAYYYQPAVLEKAGLSELPKTWEEFLTAGEQAASQGVFLSALDGEGSGIYEVLYLQRGGQFFGSDNSFALEKDENKKIAIEVLRYLQEGVQKKVFWPATGADFWGAGLMAAHKEGKVMGLAGADWWSDFILKANAKDQSGNWKIALLPKWQGGGHISSTWGGTGFCITKSSKHVDLTWDLLHEAYMTKDNQVKRYLEIKYFPHMIDALNDPQVAEVKDAFYGDQTVGTVWSDAAKDMPLMYQSPVRRDMQTELGTQCTNVFQGKQSPEAAIDAVIAVTKKAIEDL